MLKIFDRNQQLIGAFANYEDLSQHITRGSAHWSFGRRFPQVLSIKDRERNPRPLTAVEDKAARGKIPIVEMRRGHASRLQQVMLISEISLESLQRSWCLDYCREQGWFLIEVNHPISPEPLAQPVKYPATTTDNQPNRALS